MKLPQHKKSRRRIVFTIAAASLLMIGPVAAQSANSGSKLIAQSPETPPQETSSSAGSNTPVQLGTQSTSLKVGTQNTTLQVGTQSTTLQVGTDSTMLKMGTDSTLLRTGTDSSLIQAGVMRESGPVNVLFLVDCSYSMKEKLGGEMQKIDAAKKVLTEAIDRIPQDVNLGLRVFGLGFTSVPEMDCRQSALLVPLGQHNRVSIINQIRQIKPSGLTPLEYALRQAADDDLRGVEGTKTLILITDGEDTCGGHPCEFIKMLPSFGIKLKVDVVGVDLKREPKARAQLHCIAEASGGKYYDANTAADLINSVSHSVDAAVSGKVIMRSSPSPQTTPDIRGR